MSITVADNGDGIPPDQVEDVFERFHRVDPSRAVRDGGGSGLGLTIARAIADDHGGTLTAASGGPGTRQHLHPQPPRTRPGAAR